MLGRSKWRSLTTDAQEREEVASGEMYIAMRVIPACGSRFEGSKAQDPMKLQKSEVSVGSCKMARCVFYSGC